MKTYSKDRSRRGRNRRGYEHTAYWYAYHNGWTHSEHSSCFAAYLDEHMYYGFGGRYSASNREAAGCPPFDTTFNPFLLGVCIAIDIGTAMRETVKTVIDPVKREQLKKELRRDLRIVRRPFYYARETERRRALALERRKVKRRTTTAPEPTPGALLEAWNARKESKEAMIRLGGMLHDLECYVDNCLRIEGGKVVGRNRGIRGWLAEKLPELYDKYKTLMRYKAMAIRLRQVTETKDPKPTETLLRETPRHEAVEELLKDFRISFSSLMEELEFRLDPKAVFEEKKEKRISRRRSSCISIPPRVRHATERRLPRQL